MNRPVHEGRHRHQRLRQRHSQGPIHTVTECGKILKSRATEEQLRAVVARPRLAPLVASAAREWLDHILSTAEPIQIVEHISARRYPTDERMRRDGGKGIASSLRSSQ